MEILPVKTPIFKTNQSLFDFIKSNVQILSEGDILVITSKLVALSEGRVGKIEDKEKIIREEAEDIIETAWAYLTLTSRGWEINAGVDESNADNQLILLPKDSFSSAEILLEKLKSYYKISRLGIIVTDTRSMPLRVGTVGRAIGLAGFLPIKSYVGKEDLYGRESRLTASNVADALASSAVLMMGEGSEQTPFSIIKSAPVTFTDEVLSEADKKLFLLPDEDIFAHVFRLNSK